MTRKIFQSPVRTVIAAIVVLLITTKVTVAEIPRKTAAALQNRSAEKLLIEAQTVEKKSNGAGGFDLEINARVLDVEKSETELTKGDSLTIRYWIHDPNKPIPSGSYPIEIEKGKTYRAYLGPPARAYRHLDDKERTIYFPTAASGSFEVRAAFPTYPKPEKTKKNLKNYGRQNRDTISEILYGEPEKAEAYYREYLREHPNDLESQYGLVLALNCQGRTDEALKLLKASIDSGLSFSRYVAGPRNTLAAIYETDTYKAKYRRLATPIIQGPMVGATGSDFVSVWVRTDVERELTLQVSKDPKFETIAKQQQGRSFSANDYTAVIRISGLEPSTSYYYRFVANDGPVKPISTQSFTTFPAKDDKARFSIAFGGGAGYAPEHERMWDTLRSHKLSALFLLGDNVYIDWPEIPETQRYCYYRRQSRPEFRALVAKTPTYAIYDDHDFGKDDCWGGPDKDLPAWKRPVLKVFQENWANPGYGGGKQNPGCWFNTSIGDVEFFFMDCRYYRDDKRVVKPGKTMLGEYQKAELKKSILASTATFKVICSTVPMGYKTKDKKPTCDTWDGYDEERRELFKFLDDNKIEGVFILAADRHRSDARVVERESGYPLYEFMSSRLTNQIRHGHQGRGTLFSYNDKCSFGKITFDLSQEDPTATYDVINIDNEIVHSFTLKRSQLK